MLYMYSKGVIMLAIRLPKEIENRLNYLSEQTGRTKTFYAREAILNYLCDMEDIYIAQERLKNPKDTVSLDELINDEK